MAKANNPWKRSEFPVKAPGLDWDEFFRGAGLSQQPAFIVWQPSAFTGEAALVTSASLDAWKDWLALSSDAKPMRMCLPKALADEDFAFEGHDAFRARCSSDPAGSVA